MPSSKHFFLIIGIVSILLVLAAFSSYSSFLTSSQQISEAPDFQAVDVDGNAFSLSDFRDEVLVLHITNIEVPLCSECEETLNAQMFELQRLREIDPDLNIITLNLRKNPYSKDGRYLSEFWWGTNVNWIWAEDFDPYPIAGKYIDYTNFEGGFSNPTILLIDKAGQIAGVYHVYQIGKGKIDGIQDAETLQSKVASLEQGEWTGMEGVISKQRVSFLGMFALGIITSFSPCSLALLIALFSYIMTTRRKKFLSEDRHSRSLSGEGLMIGIAFTAGMALVFFIIGIFISNMGIFVRDSRFFDLIAGVILIILGINSFKPLGEIFEPLTSRIPSIRGDGEIGKKSITEQFVNISLGLFKYSTFIGAFTLGIFFSLGWAPCAISLVFPVLIWLMSQDITPLTGGLMLFVFGLGHGVPIIPVSTFTTTFGGKMGEEYLTVAEWIAKIFGIVIMIVGVVFAVRYFGYTLW
jgi:cytochrome c-type biogenesis protein